MPDMVALVYCYGSAVRALMLHCRCLLQRAYATLQQAQRLAMSASFCCLVRL